MFPNQEILVLTKIIILTAVFMLQYWDYTEEHHVVPHKETQMLWLQYWSGNVRSIQCHYLFLTHLCSMPWLRSVVASHEGSVSNGSLLKPITLDFYLSVMRTCLALRLPREGLHHLWWQSQSKQTVWIHLYITGYSLCDRCGLYTDEKITSFCWTLESECVISYQIVCF